MTPSLRSPAFLLFRLRSRALRRLPSIRQSALQYFSLNHPRNVRLQTRHVLRTFLSVVSNASSLPVGGCLSYVYVILVKTLVASTPQEAIAMRIVLALFFHRLAIVRAKAIPLYFGFRRA